MLLLLILLLMLEFLLLPLTIRLDVHHQKHTRIRIMMNYAFLRRTWPTAKKTPADGKRRKSLLLAALRESAEARNYLLHHVHLDRLDAFLRLHTQDAAGTALLTGSLKNLLYCIPPLYRPQVHIRVLPDFLHAHSTLQLVCIIRLTTGTLLLTMLKLLAFRLRQKARTAYGTSHW